MTKIIDLPTTASTDANTFVPVYKNGKTQKVSATALGGGLLGYGPGAGGTVTQSTSKSTTVVLDKPSGVITTHNAALAAGASLYFAVFTTHVDVNSAVVTTVNQNTNYRTEVFTGSGGGLFFIRLTNVTTVSLAEAVNINFAVVKVATT